MPIRWRCCSSCFLILRRLINSPFGLSLRGIRENPRRMPAIGAPSRSRIRTIYVISAAVAGLAGGLSAQTTSFVALDALSFQRSAEVLVMLILGGAGRLYGGLIGATIFMVARDQLAGMNPQYWYFWLGLLLIAVIIFLPNGILGGVAQLLSRKGRGVVNDIVLSTKSLNKTIWLAGRCQQYRDRRCRAARATL